MQAVLKKTDKDSQAVAHAGQKSHLLGFRAVMGRDRDFPYPESLFLKLDQDLRVKMILIRQKVLIILVRIWEEQQAGAMSPAIL